MIFRGTQLLFILLLPQLVFALQEDDYFKAGDVLSDTSTNRFNISSNARFIVYDVNPGEGFNLRRAVYFRVANLVKHMIDRGEEWVLVLPPWRHLYHWKSYYTPQETLPWKTFFDIPSMNLYVPVIEFTDFLEITGSNSIDHILYLQNHPDQFSSGFTELVEVADCRDTAQYNKDDQGVYRGYFWGLDVHAKKFDCVNIQGFCTVLADFLKKLDARYIFFVLKLL